MKSYLEADAASFRFLIDSGLVERVFETSREESPDLDLSRALGGGPCRMTVALGPAARVAEIGVDAVRGLVVLDAADLAPLPARLVPACAEDIDAVTRSPRDGAHAFRLRLARSSAAAAG